MAKKRIIVLGAGLAGLSAAWHLQKKGIDCRIFEKESEVGGLCRSKNVLGFTFDYDGHLLHFKRRYTFNFIKSLLGENLVQHKRSAWVYLKNKYIHYPFQANLRDLPKSIIEECLSGFIRVSRNDRHKGKENLDFSSWLDLTFGQGITKYFMSPYNIKFWTVPLNKLTCEWVDGFIPVPSLEQMIKGATEEITKQFGYNNYFWYPKKGGISQLAFALAGSIKNIHTNCPVTGIDFIKKEIRLNSGNKEKFDRLISTIPLPEIPELIKKDIPKKIKSAFSKLKWNSIFNLNLGLEKKEDDAGRHWTYFPEKKICFFRAGFPHNFSSFNTPKNKSSIYTEVAYSKDRVINKDSVISRVKKDLRKTGFLKKESDIICQDINDIKYGYPIYDAHYREARTKIIKYLNSKNIIPCGRYGSWRYFSMENAILDGRRAAGAL